jgi:hypothetical protein
MYRRRVAAWRYYGKSSYVGALEAYMEFVLVRGWIDRDISKCSSPLGIARYTNDGVDQECALGYFFRRVRKIAKSDYLIRRVRLSVYETTRLPRDGFLWNFIFEYFFFENLLRKFKRHWNVTTTKGKGKAVLLQARSGPEGSRKLRFPDFMTTAQFGGKVSLMHRPPLPPGNIPGTHFCYRLSRPQGHSATGRIMSLKNSNDTIGNRTPDLPVCSVEP